MPLQSLFLMKLMFENTASQQKVNLIRICIANFQRIGKLFWKTSQAYNYGIIFLLIVVLEFSYL